MAPRRIHANLEWLRERLKQGCSPAAVLTSAVTGQGNGKLLAEIEHVIRVKQEGSAATDCDKTHDFDTDTKTSHTQVPEDPSQQHTKPEVVKSQELASRAA